jgi:hypothetical protein
MAKILKRPKVWGPLQACRSAIFETVLDQQKRVEFLDLPIGQRSGLDRSYWHVPFHFIAKLCDQAAS